MGKPGVVTKPQMPRGPRYGPLHHLFEQLHDLHLTAGRPSLDKIAKQTGSLSKSTVSYVMSQPQVPNCDNLRAVVAALVELSPPPRSDMDTAIANFVIWWTKAAKAETAPPPSPRVQELVDIANGYLDLGREYQKAENMEANVISPRNHAFQWEHIAELSSRLRGQDHPGTVEARERANHYEMLATPESTSAVTGG